jgi:hypothetical protein
MRWFFRLYFASTVSIRPAGGMFIMLIGAIRANLVTALCASQEMKIFEDKALEKAL